MNQVFIHPFENTIGPGPYKYLGSYDMGAALAHQQSFGDTAAAFRDAPRLEAGMGTCVHCGHPILNIQIVRRGDGKLYGVGSECINKVGDGKLISAAKAEKNRIAREKSAAKREANRIARLDAQREKNGGLTDYELSEKLREEARAAEDQRLKPIIEALSPYANQLEDGNGGFRDSVARDLRNGHIPSGRGFFIMLDILAKQAGRSSSRAYQNRYNDLIDFFKQFEKVS